jgi:diguanylate cyclase (GGDEF)-like protein/PAS domain S-box-containing protein
MRFDRLSQRMMPLPWLSGALVIFACLLVIALEGWWEATAYDAVFAKARGRLSSLSQVVLDHTEDEIEAADNALRSTSHFLADGTLDDDPEGIGEVLRRQVVDVPRLRGLFFYRADGHIAGGSDRPNLNETDDSKRRYFLLHRAGSGLATTIDGIAPAKVGNLDVVQISHRINDRNGRFHGVVVSGIEPHRFFSVGSLTSSEEAVGIVVALRDGRVLARDPPARPGASPGLAPDSTDLRETGFLDSEENDDESPDELVAYRAGLLYPITVFVSRSRADVRLEWWTAALPRIAVVGCSLVAMLAAALALTAQNRRQRTLASALAKATERYRLVTEGSADLILQVTPRGRIAYASAAARTILGIDPSVLVGQNAVDALVHPADRADVQERLRRHIDNPDVGLEKETKILNRYVHIDGRVGWIEATLRSFVIPETKAFEGVVVVCRDVTEREAAARRLAELAATDDLTGLPNRRQFDSTLADEWRRARRNGTPLSLLFFDVDHFKDFNDRFGHLEGDACLKRIAQVLRRRPSRSTDLAARYGGEEFVVLLPETGSDGAVRLAEELRLMVADLPSAGGGAGVTVSIGVATMEPRTAVDNGPTDLVVTADRALYRAKNGGRNRVERLDFVTGTSADQPMPPRFADPS